MSEKKYESLEQILWRLAYYIDVEDVKEHTKLYIESKVMLKHTIRDLNMFVKLAYEYNQKNNKPHQLDYYPEIKLR